MSSKRAIRIQNRDADFASKRDSKRTPQAKRQTIQRRQQRAMKRQQGGR